jgi:hypothetical protein
MSPQDNFDQGFQSSDGPPVPVPAGKAMFRVIGLNTGLSVRNLRSGTPSGRRGETSTRREYAAFQ